MISTETESEKLVSMEIIPESNQDTIPQQGCFSNWIGRNVTSYFPGGRYTRNAYLKVNVVVVIMGILSVNALMLGTIWRDSLSDTQRAITTSTAVAGAISSVSVSLVSYAIFNNQPSS